MSSSDKPAPVFLDPSFLSPVGAPAPVPAARVPSAVELAAAELAAADDDDDDDDEDDEPAPPVVAAPAPVVEAPKAPPPSLLTGPFEGLTPIDLRIIPDKFRQHVDPNAPPPVRLMGARAMVPMGPKDMVHVVYQGIFDPEPKIAALAKKSFEGFDDRILDVALKEQMAPQVLELFARVLGQRPKRLEQVLLNRTTPDTAFVWVAGKTDDQGIVSLIASNQERLLRSHDITRALASNPHALRSEIDRAIDFLVREGVFLDDVDEFVDAFARLGKHEMLEALKKIEISDAVLTNEQKEMADKLGVDAETLLLGTADVVASLDGGEETEGAPESGRRNPLHTYPIPIQIKLAMVGDHGAAMEAVHSTNRVVAGAGIRNPKINDSDVMKIVRSRTLADDVVRYICNNGDWTKSYAVKFALVQHPKTPITLVMRWLPLLRQNDVRALAKSKNIPSAVQAHAKKMTQTKRG